MFEWSSNEVVAAMSSLLIAGKALGKSRKPLFEDFSVPFPPNFRDGDSFTLRQLITHIVHGEVEAFHNRQEQRQLARVLSPKQIRTGAERGKIDPAAKDVIQNVDDADAVATALQAFEDGLYLVIIDGREYRDLDEQVYLQANSRVTFVRLVFLAGA